MKIKHILLSTLVPLIIVGLIALIAFFTCRTGLVSNDCYEQYVPFFNAYYDILKNGKSIFYSLTGSMGYDFYAVFSYYLVSPLNFIILILEKENIIYAVNILIILKIAISGGTFSAFIKNRYPEAGCKKVVMFSTFYALSGFTAGYLWNIMWLDGVLMFPLVIMGMDILLRDEDSKWYWYTLFLSIMIITSYFIGYMSCIFIFMFFFTYKFKNFGDFMLKLLKIAGASILAIGISAIILLPSFGGVQSTYISGENLPKPEFYGSFADSFKTVMVGIPANGINFSREYGNLYMTVFVMLLAFVYFCTGSVKVGDKIRKIILLGIMLFSFNFKPLNFIWHGMHEQTGIPNRFSFMIIFLLITMAFEVTMKKKQEIKTSSVFVGWGIMSLCMLIMAYFKFDLFIYAIATIALGLLYAIFMTAIKKGKVKSVLTSVFAFLELIIMFIVGFCNSSAGLFGDYTYYLSDFEKINNEKEPGYYREKIDETYNEKEEHFEKDMYYIENISVPVLIDYADYMRNIGHLSIVNEATIYGINSLSLFNTFNNYSQTKFYNSLGATGGTNNVMYYGENAFMDMLLGVKYYYTRYYDVNSTAYEYVKTVGNVKVYENKYVLSTGYAIPSELLENEDILSGNSFDSMNKISDIVTGKDVFTHKYFKNNSELSSDDLKVFEYTADMDEELLYEVHGNDIEKITCYINDDKVFTGNRNNCMFDFGVIKKDSKVRIEVKVDSSSEDAAAWIQAANVDMDAVKETYNILAKNELEVMEYSDDYLKGKVSLTEKSDYMITIPYMKGWKIFVDGKETSCDTFCNLFIVLHLDPGEHEIEMRYESPGFKTGALISAASIGITIIALTITLLIRRDRKKSKILESQN